MSARPPIGSRKPVYTQVHGISDRTGMPRVGKLRLGEKGVSTSGKEYPREIDYFRIDPDQGLLPDERAKLIEKFHLVYGQRPAVLHDVYFPSDIREEVFPNELAAYQRTENGAKKFCHGDGVRASRLNYETGLYVERDCCQVAECEIWNAKKCSLKSALRIFIPKVTMAGYWQVDTGSQASTGNVIDLINQLLRMFGRLTSIPLVLSREPVPMVYEGKTNVHHILKLRAPNVDMDELRALIGRNQFALPAAADLEVDEEDVPEELVPATVQEPKPDPELMKRITDGFDILGTKEPERLVSLHKYKEDLPGLLREINNRIDRQNTKMAAAQ